MLQWLKKLFQKKKNDCCDIKIESLDRCGTCVWWASELDNNMPNAEIASKLFAAYPGEYKFCDIQKDYTHRIHSCNHYIEERFEASADSIQTEEYELNSELSIEGSSLSDPSRKEK